MKRPVGLPLSRKALYLLFPEGPGDVLRSEPDTPVPRIARVADVQYKKNNHSYGQGSLQTSQREALQTLNAQIAGQQQKREEAQKSGNLKRLRNTKSKLETLPARLKTAEGGTAM